MGEGPSEHGLPSSVLVLAGRRGSDDPLAQSTGASHRALVPVGGTPMLERVVVTLLDFGIERVAVSTDARELTLAIPTLRGLAGTGRLEVRSSAASPAASVVEFLNDASAARLPCLVTTADHALLTPAIVRAFWAEARRSDADLAIGIVRESVFRASYPDTQRTFLRLADDSFKAANLFAFLRPTAAAVPAFWRRVEQDRKQPWRLVRAFGAVTLLAYVTGQLTVAHALERVRATTGARLALVPLPFAEAAIDVDKPEDLEVANTVMAARAAPALGRHSVS